MRLLTTLMILGCASFSIGQTIATEAPSVSASGTTVPKNTFQIESSLGISSSSFMTTITLPYTLFRLGLSDRWELRLNNSFNIRKFSGSSSADYEFGSFQVGTKFQFIKNPESKTRIAVTATATIPTYDNSMRTGQLNLSFSQQLASNHSFGFNVGYTPSFSSSTTNPDIIKNVNYSLIYGYSLNSKLSLFAEIYGNYYENPALAAPVESFGIDFGIMYLVRDNIQIDYAYGRGLTSNSEFHTLGFNILLNSKK